MNNLVELIVIKLVERHGDAVQLLDPSTKTKGKERLVCMVGADYVREIARLPRERAAKLMRTLLVSGKR